MDAKDWIRRWNDNQADSLWNSLKDSGWSAEESHRCTDRALGLMRELVCELKSVQATAEDFFDRPGLVAVLAAVEGIELYK